MTTILEEDIGRLRIYYPSDINESELSAIRKYWQISDIAENEAIRFKFKVSDIAKDLGIREHDFRQQVLVDSFPLTETGELITCESCHSPLLFKSRSDINSSFQNLLRGHATCHECFNLEMQKRLIDKNEQKQKSISADNEIKEKNYRSLINDLSTKIRPFDINKISLINAANLLCWLTASNDTWNGMTFTATDVAAKLIYCDAEDSWKVLRRLFEEGVIYISPETSFNAFIYDENNYPAHYSKNQVIWSLGSNDMSENDIATLLYSKLESTNHSSKDVMDVFDQVAMSEVYSYLDEQLASYNMGRGLRSGPTEASLTFALDNYSIAQVNNLSWRAVKNAASLAQKQEYSYQHAINTIPGNIRKYVDKSIAENWTINPYSRHPSHTQPLMTSLLFDSILKCGKDGYLNWSRNSVRQHLGSIEFKEDGNSQDVIEKGFFLLQFVLNKPDFSKFDLAVLNSYKGFRLVGDIKLDEETSTYTATATYDDYYDFDRTVFINNIAVYFGYRSELASIKDVTNKDFISIVTTLINSGHKCPKNIKESIHSLINENLPMWDSIYNFISSSDRKSNIIGMLDATGSNTEFECSSSSHLYTNNYSVRLPFNLNWSTKSNLNKLCVAANKNTNAFAQEYASNLLENIADMELASKVADYLVKGVRNPKPKIESDEY